MVVVAVVVVAVAVVAAHRIGWQRVRVRVGCWRFRVGAQRVWEREAMASVMARRQEAVCSCARARAAAEQTADERAHRPESSLSIFTSDLANESSDLYAVSPIL